MWKTLRILGVCLAFLMPSCGAQSEVTVTTTHVITTMSTTTTLVQTTTIPTTSTTLKQSTYRAVSQKTPDGIWDDFAQCESGGDWSRRGRYDGGLQFDPSTWTAYVASGRPYGLFGYPSRAYDASREQQIAVATRVRDGVHGSSDPYLNPQGWDAWPTCRYQVGV